MILLDFVANFATDPGLDHTGLPNLGITDVSKVRVNDRQVRVVAGTDESDALAEPVDTCAAGGVGPESDFAVYRLAWQKRVAETSSGLDGSCAIDGDVDR